MHQITVFSCTRLCERFLSSSLPSLKGWWWKKKVKPRFKLCILWNTLGHASWRHHKHMGVAPEARAMTQKVWFGMYLLYIYKSHLFSFVAHRTAVCERLNIVWYQAYRFRLSHWCISSTATVLAMAPSCLVVRAWKSRKFPITHCSNVGGSQARLSKAD